MINKFKLAVCQIKTTENKLDNIQRAWKMLQEVKKKGASIAVLGEMFNVPYNLELFKDYAEKLENSSQYISSNFDIIMNSKAPSIDFLKFASDKLQLLLIGGSIPLQRQSDIFNTSLVFDNGELIGHHDKLHPFDITLPGSEHKESQYVKPGNKVTVLSTRFGNLGIGICYDIRFASYAMAMRKMQADILIYPSVFTLKTGEMHFHKSGQSRAIDTQSYVVLASNARYVENHNYNQSYAHSAIIDYDANIMSSLEEKEGYLIEEIDLFKMKQRRKQIPSTTKHERNDVYNLELKNPNQKQNFICNQNYN